MTQTKLMDLDTPAGRQATWLIDTTACCSICSG
jgi:hypothetical protein